MGTDYPGAAGITVFFTQHTNINHNELYNLPYSGMSIGVVQGHVDNADHPENSTNINSDNTISNNLIHDVMQDRIDGGAIYIEGHQGQNIFNGGTLDTTASLAHGLTLSGNVAYNQKNLFNTWYDDAGTQWIDWTGNVEWHGYPQGGCEASGHISYIGNYDSDGTGAWSCENPNLSDVHITNNTHLPPSPGAAELPLNVLGNAGLTPAFQHLEAGDAPRVTYAERPGGTPSTPQVFIAGAGFGSNTQVSFGTTPANSTTVLNDGFLVATAPTGTDLSQVTVTTPSGTATADTIAGRDPSRGTAITNIVPNLGGGGGCIGTGAGGPDAMVDGDPSTYFCTGELPQPGDYVGVDLGSVKSIQSANLQMGTSDFPNDYLHSAVLEYSTDDVTWTSAGTFATATVTATFPAGTQARYIRLRATATDAFWLRVPEFTVSVS